MQLMNVFSLGYAGCDFEEFGDWRSKINNSTPIKLSKAAISSSIVSGGYFAYLIYAEDSVWMLEYALIDNGMQDFIRWLESICLGCSESILLMNQEGPIELVRAYQECRSDDIRLTMISNEKRFYHPEKHQYFSSAEFAEKVEQTGEPQVVFDIIINKWDFVEVLYVLTTIMAEKEKEQMNKSEIIESSIKELPEEHENMFFQKEPK